MEELTVEEHKELIQQTIKDLTLSKEFPETVKKLMATPEWKQVIEEVYIDNFAKDLVRNYDEWEDDKRTEFDEEYKVRSRFLNTMQVWSEMGDKANEQIERLNVALEDMDKPQPEEPTINTH